MINNVWSNTITRGGSRIC